MSCVSNDLSASKWSQISVFWTDVRKSISHLTSPFFASIPLTFQWKNMRKQLKFPGLNMVWRSILANSCCYEYTEVVLVSDPLLRRHVSQYVPIVLLLNLHFQSILFISMHIILLKCSRNKAHYSVPSLGTSKQRRREQTLACLMHF